MYVTSMSDTVSLINSCKGQHRKKKSMVRVKPCPFLPADCSHAKSSLPTWIFSVTCWFLVAQRWYRKRTPGFGKSLFLVPSYQSSFAFGIVSEPLKADSDNNLAGLLGSLAIMHANCLGHWQCPVYGSYQHYCTERGSKRLPPCFLHLLWNVAAPSYRWIWPSSLGTRASILHLLLIGFLACHTEIIMQVFSRGT